MVQVGEFDVKNCSATRSIIKTNISAVSSNNFLHDAKSKAGANLLARIRPISLSKFLKNIALEIFRNSTTVVLHRDANGLRAFLRIDYHFSARRRELDRIRK